MALKIVSAGESEASKASARRKQFNDDLTKLVVSKITQQVKRQDRYSVYVNGAYSFSLHEHQLAGSKLRNGVVLTKDELENFANESQFGKAYERALNYVMIRPRSEKEIKEYLTRTFLYPKPKVFTDKSGQRHIKPQIVDKEQTRHMINRVVERLQEKGYINDESFARAWVQSRQLTKKTSIRKLQQELQHKGVGSEIIATVLQKQNENELQNLRDLIKKKKRLPKYQDKVKLMQYLARQGFRYDDIKENLDSGDLYDES
ncbi:MAG TPA: RecX family transcriptional regulator [Candidatus Saccharibacteria bacterium]|jgi:regulatory protein|nr:regulatory protein [Patescibacteria group bacterium]HMS31145.1 RecX family transcriptional regulator [Candidatus Saccharibacteria bacterium]